jgi:ribonuclease T2
VRTPKLLGALAFLASFCVAAVAETSDCILDHCEDHKPQTETAGGGGGARAAGDFDFYVLALSWSPGFCEVDGARRRQCEPGSNLGFVLHGLWPQYESGGFPQDCPGPRTPSRIALEHAQGVYPDEGLARYEWRKHGTCVGRSPSDYFSDAGRARETVSIPAAFTKPSEPQTYTPIDIERAFLAANPRLRPGMMAVNCRKGLLDGVRICLSKDLREFHACPEVARRTCRAREITVPPTY